MLTKLRSAPVEIGGARARQVDQTTCGSACLLMLAATGDSRLMEWLETGQYEGARPPEVPAGHYPDAASRIAAAQRQLKHRTGRAALGPIRWPGQFGTPPWTAAREARFPGVRYTHRPVDDRGARGAEMVSLLVNALRAGYPVLVYSGGSIAQGAATAIPRHVVLAVPGSEVRITPEGDEIISLYEPSEGLVHEVRAGDLRDRTTPMRALGNWSHVQWLCLPVPSRPTSQGIS